MNLQDLISAIDGAKKAQEEFRQKLESDEDVPLRAVTITEAEKAQGGGE